MEPCKLHIELHVVIAREGILERDLVIGTDLLDTYVKYGIIVKTQEVFDNLPA